MLGKLIKFEWKDTYLIGTISGIVVLILALIGAIVFQTDLWNMDFRSSTAESLVATTIIFYFTAYIMGIGAMVLVMRYYFFWRYYKNLFTDQGYLMNTLPVTGSQLLNAKLLVALVWQYITWIVVSLAIFILAFGFMNGIEAVSLGELMEALREGIHEIYRDIPGELTIYFVSIMLIILISPLSEIMLMYTAVGIGQLNKKHKFLISVLILIGLYMARSFLLQIAMVPMNFMVVGTADVWAFNVGSLITLFVLIGMIIGLWFLNKYFIEKRLNLE